MENNSEKRPKRPKKRRGCLVVLITVLIIFAMLAAAGVIYWISFVKPPKADASNGRSGDYSVINGFDADGSKNGGDDGKTDEDLLNEIKTQGQSISINGSERKEDCFTMLVLGLDKSDLRTDTIIVATFNVKDKTASVLNIPRDTMSSYNGGKIHKINSAYASGGIDRSIEEIQNLIGFEIDRYAVVTCEAFTSVIDAIGGIDYYVPKDMYKNTGDMIIDLKEGQQHLDGEHALMYMRYRGYPNADLARIEAQQGFYQAVIEKIARPATIFKLPTLASAVLKELETDLTIGEMIWIGLNYASMDTGSMVYNTLPNEPEYINDISYVIPQEEKIIDLVNEYYNPYTERITSLKLASVPKDSSSSNNTDASHEVNDNSPEKDTEVPDEGEYTFPDDTDEPYIDDDDIPFWMETQDGDVIIGNDPDVE